MVVGYDGIRENVGGKVVWHSKDAIVDIVDLSEALEHVGGPFQI